MLELSVSPAARTVLDALASASAPVRAGDLVREIAATPPGPGSDLLAELGPVAQAETAVDIALLRAAANQEALRAGAPRIGCEHLVAGFALASGGSDFPDITSVRAQLQARIGDVAGRAYEKVESRREPDGDTPFALVVTGLPGSGKSTLAEALATRLGAAGCSLDWQLGALTPFGLVRSDNAVPLAYHLQTAALAEQLRLGVSVVLDADGHLRVAGHGLLGARAPHARALGALGRTARRGGYGRSPRALPRRDHGCRAGRGVAHRWRLRRSCCPDLSVAGSARASRITTERGE